MLSGDPLFRSVRVAVDYIALACQIVTVKQSISVVASIV